MAEKITGELVYRFIRNHRLAVVSTTTMDSKPESALVGIAINEKLEIIFDTVRNSRKYRNIETNPHEAVVVGWNDETTVQYEGIAAETDSIEMKEIYFSVFPQGRERERWPNIVYIKIKPKWIRYSNFNEPQTIGELTFDE